MTKLHKKNRPFCVQLNALVEISAVSGLQEKSMTNLLSTA